MCKVDTELAKDASKRPYGGWDGRTYLRKDEDSRARRNYWHTGWRDAGRTCLHMARVGRVQGGVAGVARITTGSITADTMCGSNPDSRSTTASWCGLPRHRVPAQEVPVRATAAWNTVATSTAITIHNNQPYGARLQNNKHNRLFNGDLLKIYNQILN